MNNILIVLVCGLVEVDLTRQEALSETEKVERKGQLYEVNWFCMRLHFLTDASMKMTVLWNVVPCSWRLSPLESQSVPARLHDAISCNRCLLNHHRTLSTSPMWKYFTSLLYRVPWRVCINTLHERIKSHQIRGWERQEDKHVLFTRKIYSVEIYAEFCFADLVVLQMCTNSFILFFVTLTSLSRRPYWATCFN